MALMEVNRVCRNQMYPLILAKKKKKKRKMYPLNLDEILRGETFLKIHFKSLFLLKYFKFIIYSYNGVM